MKVVNTTLPLQTHTYTYILHFFFMFPLYRLSMEAIILQISTTFGYSEIAKEGLYSQGKLLLQDCYNFIPRVFLTYLH